jgi:hypothetical protein
LHYWCDLNYGVLQEPIRSKFPFGERDWTSTLSIIHFACQATGEV